MTTKKMGEQDFLKISLEDCFWAKQLWWQARAETWEPEIADFEADGKRWRASCVTDSERQIMLEYFSHLIVASALVESSSALLYQLIGNRPCQEYLLEQAREAAKHADICVCACIQMGLESHQVGDHVVPIRMKQFLDEQQLSISRGDDVSVVVTSLIKAIVRCWLLAEVSLVSSFFQIFMDMRVSQELKNVRKMSLLTICDLLRQHEFGCNLINELKNKYPTVWEDSLKDELAAACKSCAECAQEYVRQVAANYFLSQESADDICQQVACLADYTCERIDLPRQFGTHGHPRWMVLVQKWQGESADEDSPQAPVTPPAPRGATRQVEQS